MCESRRAGRGGGGGGKGERDVVQVAVSVPGGLGGVPETWEAEVYLLSDLKSAALLGRKKQLSVCGVCVCLSQ